MTSSASPRSPKPDPQQEPAGQSDEKPGSQSPAGRSSPSESKPRRPRTRITEEQRRLVALHYPACRTREEKLELCRKVGVNDIRQLYNLACQMGITRGREDLTDAEFRQYLAGNKSIMRRRYNPEDEKRLLQKREDPRTTVFTPEDDKFIIDNFGRLDIWKIAEQRGHSETAILYRARHLTRQERDQDGNLLPPQPLRRPAVGFTLKRVAAWLGLSESEVMALRAAGVQIRPLKNRKDQTVDHWVLARSLAPFLRKYGARLIKERNADKFFIKEILETEQILAENEERASAARAPLEEALESEDPERIVQAQQQVEENTRELKREGVIEESCYFLDHGHKCQNPWAGPCYKLFCDGEDPKCLVKDLRW